MHWMADWLGQQLANGAIEIKIKKELLQGMHLWPARASRQ
jgi:hypothetical protein